jgi:outer membrane protein OmpA-like peptidoglycan-associated protein/outer membrane protein W
MTFRSALLAATIVALPLAAKAQPVNGLYVGAGAGANFMQDEKIKGINAYGHGGVTGSGASIDSHTGPVVVGSVGYGLGNGLRVELEGSYRYNSFGGLSDAPRGTSFGGKEQKYGAMLNVLYDFYGLTPVVVPYLGIGAGYQWAQFNSLHGTGAAGGVPTTYSGGTHAEGAIAYQAIIGAALPIAAVPGLALTAEYRFMGLTGNRDYPIRAIVGRAAGSGALRTNEEYNHSALIGVRYNFGQAPAPVPAPAPAPVAAPARSYLVFFDWDKATLTDRARQIISEAAANSTKVQYTRIEVNGYTDTSGTPKYNQGLSVRRAQAVAAELVKDGVPQNAISIQGFGETHLLVPTGPNVREPQNRRVEIIIR